MPHYRIRYMQDEWRICLVEAESESAARQAWLNGEYYEDEFVDCANQHVLSIEEFEV
jgi:hypothetical protein